MKTKTSNRIRSSRRKTNCEESKKIKEKYLYLNEPRCTERNGRRNCCIKERKITKIKITGTWTMV